MADAAKNQTKPPIDLNEFLLFLKEFERESDRAAVILGAARLDILLCELLERALRPNTGRSDDLLEGDAPLGTFSARITAAHRLGLIDDAFCRALHLVRKIRNSFAHDSAGVSLQSGAHRDRVKELVQGINPELMSRAAAAFFENGQSIGPSIEFRTAVAMMSAAIDKAAHTIKPVFIRDPPVKLLQESPQT